MVMYDFEIVCLQLTSRKKKQIWKKYVYTHTLTLTLKLQRVILTYTEKYKSNTFVFAPIFHELNSKI